MAQIAAFAVKITCPACRRSATVSVRELRRDDGSFREIRFVDMPPDFVPGRPVRELREPLIQCKCGERFLVDTQEWAN